MTEVAAHQADGPARRRELLELLGDLPPVRGAVGSRLVARREMDGYVLEHLVLDLNGLEPVPAYFTRPQGAAGRSPAVVFNHSYGGSKEQLLDGGGSRTAPAWAEALARRGVAALGIDAWNFGDRRGRTDAELFKEMLWKGQVLWGMMVFDALRALDYLAGREDVDASRIGTLGTSMGSTTGWWLAALDRRVRVCVEICGLIEIEGLVRQRGLDGLGLYYCVPSLGRHFSAADIASLIAPRAHLSLAGEYDRLTPADTLGVIDQRLRAVYAASGAPDAWRLSRYPVGHVETAEMRLEAMAFLEQWL